MTDATVFIVSDDPAVRDALSELAASAGLQAETYPSLAAWHGVVPTARRGCLLRDARAEDFAGPARRAQQTAACAVRPVPLLVDRGDVATTVSPMRAGVFEVVEKRPRNGHLLERIRLAAAASQPAPRST